MEKTIIPASECKVNINDEVKVGDTTMFNIDGKMTAVEITQLIDCRLKIMTCDLEMVWDNISLTTWLRQVEFMKQID